jgi:hypothetical protein
MAKFVPFLRKQAKLTRKRTKSLDSANWTGSLSHVSALKSANPKSGAYTKYCSVDSDIVNYVNRNEVDEDKMRTIKRTQKARPRTPLPPPFPQQLLPGFDPETINKPLPSAPLMRNVERDVGTLYKMLFFAKSTFFHADQRESLFFTLELLFFILDSFFHAVSCSVKKSNSSVKKSSSSVKKSTFFTQQVGAPTVPAVVIRGSN